MASANHDRPFIHSATRKTSPPGKVAPPLKSPATTRSLTQMKILSVQTLPEVLTIRQVHQIIDACTTQRMAVYFWTVYSMRLRLEEGHFEGFCRNDPGRRWH